MTTYRSPREYAWAAWLDCLSVPYQYEALQARLSKALRYQPDFWLPATEAWLEIKAARPTYGEARVAKQLAEADARPVFVAAGWPYSGESLQVWKYQRDGFYLYGLGRDALRLVAGDGAGVSYEAALAAARAVSVRHSEFCEVWASARKMER